ncbi:MAG: dihydrodipicolinate synthase family protein [Chloroflexota bacterium]|nr:dihydrodipicolinate synthase family protein [Chloroflexota bacterium]
MSNATTPSGVFPAMITPLKMDKSIDWDGIDRLTDWYIESGVTGLFAVGQSSEMFALSDDERLRLAARVVKRSKGRVPVVASGTFDRSVARQVKFVRQMADLGVAQVVVIASMMAQPEDDDTVWRSHVSRLLEATGDIPLGLYECPQPYHRLVSADLVTWAAGTGRFRLLKETSRSISQLRAKIEAAEGSSLCVYNADATTLLESMKAGASGYCGIAANFYPQPLVWLCKHFLDTEAVNAQTLIRMADPTIHHQYPVSAKYYRRQAGFDMTTVSRVSNARLTDYDQRVLDSIARQMDRLILEERNLTA